MSPSSYIILISYCFLSLFQITKTSGTQEIVKVSLYYESLCPYSREFVKDQLFPGYLKIKDSLIVDLVPYGKANQTKIDGKWKFNCQHGAKECFGNKIQACVLGQSLQRESKIDFVGCIMSSSDPSNITNAETCAANNNIEWSTINNCLKGTEGDQLLAHYGDRTKSLQPKLAYVPHILFNGILNATLENEARNDFLQTVCTLLIVKPDGCNAKINE